jgi:hypothetical protein
MKLALAGDTMLGRQGGLRLGHQPPESLRSPNFDPAGLATRAPAEYAASLDLLDMVREDLIAERVAIERAT